MTNYGIALCRVSTSKQRLEGSSLSAQETRINKVSLELFDCQILRTWSLDISSRKGKNYKRKDLEEMLKYCKEDKRIKYLFVDEHDRYMRSVDEYYMWKGRFLYEAKVTLVIAAKPELALNPNSASMAIEFFGIWQGETSNEERITKTTDKMQAKILSGYFPGVPHTAYKKTDIKGLHEPVEPYWTLLQSAMQRILYGGYSLHQALVWLQSSGFAMRGKGRLQMDRFKEVLVDPYYAGITKMSNWEVEGLGLHKSMITRSEHEQLKEIVSGVKKKFTRNVHNPNFPMSNILECVECGELEKPDNRFTGYKNHNGKRLEIRKYYEWYRCRSCDLGIKKTLIHEQVTAIFETMKISDSTKAELKQAMNKVWQQRNGDKVDILASLRQKQVNLLSEKDNLIRAIGSSPLLAADIEMSVVKIKAELEAVEAEIKQADNVDNDFNEFVEFSLGYVDDLNANWWTLTPDRRERCKQLSFPEGIFVDRNKKVSTQNISPIYRYDDIKKEPQRALVYVDGGPGGTRTRDILLKRQTL